MGRNPLAGVPEPTAVGGEVLDTAEDGRDGNEDSYINDMETDEKAVLEQIMEFASGNQDDNSVKNKLKGEDERIVEDLHFTYMEKGENKPRLQWEIFEEENRRLVDSFELQDDASHDNDEDIEVETAEAPPEMLFPLLRYQKEWLAWVLKQESSSFRGGLLADETGMGKTIQAIALVLAKCAIKRSNAGTCNSSPTLVICPWAALKHWETEFTQCMPQGSVKARDHPYLVIYSKPKEALCDICKCVAKDLAVTSCGHTFWKGCLEDFTKIMDKSLCPTCSLSFTLNFEPRKICGGQFSEATAFETSSILGGISPENFETSTKIEALGIRFSYRHAGEVIN